MKSVAKQNPPLALNPIQLPRFIISMFQVPFKIIRQSVILRFIKKAPLHCCFQDIYYLFFAYKKVL